MSTYTSKPQLTEAPIEAVYERISHLGSLQERIEALPADIRAKLGEVTFTDDSIVINAGPVGAITFDVVERTAPVHVALQAQNSPVPLKLSLNLKQQGETTTELTVVIEIDIPVMLKPMIGPKMQDAVDKLAELVGKINYNA